MDYQKRQQGGIGSAAHDPAQKDIRAFFGGAKLDSASNVATEEPASPTLEEGRAASNVFDEVTLKESTDNNA